MNHRPVERADHGRSAPDFGAKQESAARKLRPPNGLAHGKLHALSTRPGEKCGLGSPNRLVSAMESGFMGHELSIAVIHGAGGTKKRDAAGGN